MKTLEFLYQETQIHFLVNPTKNNVMVNATEMAKMFGKKTELFLKTKHAKAFIQITNAHQMVLVQIQKWFKIEVTWVSISTENWL